MARKKKTPPPEKKTLAPGIESAIVGKGITRRSHISVRLDVAAAEDAKHVLRIKMADAGESFEQEIARHEREAIKILKDAGLPTNYGDSRTPPKEWDVSPTNTLDGRIKKVMFILSQMHPELGGMGLAEFVTSRGKREFEDPEWYAAAIIEAISIARASMRRKDMDFALHQALKIGELVTEAKGLGYSVETGKTGPPKRKRRKSPYPTLARYLLRNYPDETDEHRFKMVPSNTELLLNGHKFYREAGRIHAEKRERGKWESVGRPLKIAAFRKHMTAERKRISR